MYVHKFIIIIIIIITVPLIADKWQACNQHGRLDNTTQLRKKVKAKHN